MAITLRPQNDSGTVFDANTYSELDYFKSYHEEAGNDLSDYDDETLKAALVRAFRYMDNRHNYKGERANSQQNSAFPRYNLTDRDYNTVYGIPLPVKDAQNEYAYEGLENGQLVALNPTPTRDASGARVIQKSETVGPISESVTFASGATFSMPEYPQADSILKSRGYVIFGGTIIRG